MTYDPAIPAANDDPSDSQGEIQTNFNTIKVAFDLNHVALGSGGSQGKHKFLEMPNQATIPAGLVANEGTLYTKLVSSISQLFYSPDASGNEYQLTFAIPANLATFKTNPGWSYLPGGLLLLYGTVAPTSSTTVTINFAALGLPNFSSPAFNIQVTRQRTTSDPGSSFQYYVDNTTVATTGFNILNRDGHTYGYYWMAIGV